MKRVDANNVIAIGGATMGISAAMFLICLCMFYCMASLYSDFTLLMALLILVLMIAFITGSWILIAGIIMKIIQSAQKPDVYVAPVNTNVKETVSSVKNETPEETGGKVICPHCGKEQQKNPFGCIYCHEKLFD